MGAWHGHFQLAALCWDRFINSHKLQPRRCPLLKPDLAGTDTSPWEGKERLALCVCAHIDVPGITCYVSAGAFPGSGAVVRQPACPAVPLWS